MRTQLLGLPVDVLTLDETVAIAVAAMSERRPCQHVALNVAKLVNARRDPELDRDIRDSDIVGIDGMGIAWALGLLGAGIPDRVAGIDLFERLMGASAEHGFRPYLLGATPAVLDAAIRTLRQRHPALVIAGRHHGYFGPDEEGEICRAIAGSGADGLFVAMPTPHKERFMLRNRDRLGVPFAMGIGGTFDVIAGEVGRAPRLVQRAGLEWLFRLAQEPRRLAGRYLRTNAVFAGLVLREIAQRAAARLGHHRAAGENL